MEEGRGMLERGTTTVTPSNLCVLMSLVGGGTATITILNQECMLMSMLGGGATTISTLKRVCSCQCLEVAQ